MSDSFVVPEIDQARAWELYCALNGDTLQVATALAVPEVAVTTVAQRFEWPARLQRLTHAKGHLGTLRTLSRAQAAVQAQRLSNVLDNVLESIECAGGTPEERKAVLEDWTTVIGKGGASRSGAALMQLAAAIETAQKLRYRALGDDGSDSGQGDSVGAAGELLMSMQRALATAANATGVPAGKLAAQVISG